MYPTHRFSFFAMGSVCELQLQCDEDLAQNLARRVRDDVEGLERRYSRFRSDSLLSAINRVADAGGEIAVDAETSALLDYAAVCYDHSDGLFDISAGVLGQAWNFSGDKLPEPAHIEALLARVGWHYVQWRRPLLRFSRPGMSLDFGGIVKEYAVDRAAALCLDAGVSSALINLGGDVRVTGPQADGCSWTIGVRHPRESGALLCTLALASGGLASSGDYERCLIVDGVRYGHILDPRSGWPTFGLAAVSVLADSCLVAGSASTIAMLKGSEGSAWLEELGLPHLWVAASGAVGGNLIDCSVDQPDSANHGL